MSIVQALHKLIEVLALKKHEKQQKNNIKKLAIAAISCVILTVALGFGVLVYYFAPRKTDTRSIAVPVLEGMRWKDIDMAQSFSITPEYEYSDKVEEGKIMSQSPAAQSVRKVAEGEKLEIVVKVSLGKKTDKLPHTVGMPYVAAAIKLREIGADVIVIPVFDSKENAGTVISTDPPEDAEIQNGDRVIMYVARNRAKATVRVPNLVGTDVEAACVEILKLGLKLGKITDEGGNDAHSGTVTAQSLTEGMYVKNGTYIDLVVVKTQEEQIENNGDTGQKAPWWHFGLW
ncbi:MAG: PASTA domain-containing protein [Clostridia bacterium]|nr:PASTA domain-containing protein [Clostridia bacterium]